MSQDEINLPIAGEFHERIKNLMGRRAHKSTEAEIAYEALNIGLNALEATLNELDDGTLAKVFENEAREDGPRA